MAERKSFLLRMDPDLYAALESWAQEQLRSVNGQIEFVLREAVRQRRGADEATETNTARAAVKAANDIVPAADSGKTQPVSE
jgi:hypothetical protein